MALIILAIFAVILFLSLQIYICKNEKIFKYGLILPVGSLILNILPVISFCVMFVINLFSLNNDNNFISIFDANVLPNILIQIFSIIFLVIVIFAPTLCFYLIYLYYRKKHKKL